ncbi:MAG TPA: hypothetical protein VF156_15505 [Agromyces sp.]
MQQTTDNPSGALVPATAAPTGPASTQALAVLDPGAIALPDPAALESFASQMAGLEDSLDFDRVKIPSGGGRAFEIPTGDGDEVDVVQALDGVILYDHPTAVLWLDSLDDRADGDGGRPDAWSPDGVTQVVPEETIAKCRERGLPIPSTVLKDCPYNQWGSDPKGGRGKWTKNQHRLYVLRPGTMMPVLLTLPPTSIDPFGKWKGKRILLGGFGHPANVLARITLKVDESAGGISYSKCQFAVAARLSPEDAAKAHALAEQLQPLFHKHAADVTTLEGSVVETPSDAGTFGGSTTPVDADLDAAFAAAPSGGDGFVSAADAVEQAGVGEAPPQAANEVF